MSENDYQVGGDHYKSTYQHWDFVADTGMDYWQAAASKYVARCFKKNGAVDLQKAAQYMRKRHELAAAGMPEAVGMTEYNTERLNEFCSVNNIEPERRLALELILEGSWLKAADECEALCGLFINPTAINDR